MIVIGLSVVVLFVSFNYLLVPAYNTYSERFDTYERLSFEKMLAEEKIMSEPATTAIYNRTAGEYEQKSKLVSKELSNLELDRLITGICLNQGLIPTSLSIVPAKTAPPAETDSAGEEPAPPGIRSADVKVRVNSSYKNLQDLIDEINEISYIYISAFSYKYDAKNSGADNIQADIDFRVLMESEIIG